MDGFTFRATSGSLGKVNIKHEIEEVRENDAYQIEVKVEDDMIFNDEAIAPKLETTFREIIKSDIYSIKSVTPTIYINKDVKIEENSAVVEPCSSMSFAGTTRIISSDSTDVYRYKFHGLQSETHNLEPMGIHVEEKPYRCSNCEKCCVQKGDFLEHQRLHTDEKSYWCYNCEKTQEHQITHMGKEPYRCSNCDSKFYCQCGLTQHQRTHTGEKPFQCRDCEKFFVYKCALEKHKRTHIDVQPYQCSNCDKYFVNQSSLVKHQSIHKEEKSFQCSQCEKCFVQKDALEEHQRIHRPYQCSICDKCFTRESALIQHQKMHRITRKKI
ncbi:unnamed protein product [Meganyctiphanes norvegica]|uniref:C2H2-type domain-containing protein n=1 Tax=Meganyctiphanes norvegica TaxID=48144 RepID=A0AAV2RYE4_MEGNR